MYTAGPGDKATAAPLKCIPIRTADNRINETRTVVWEMYIVGEYYNVYVVIIIEIIIQDSSITRDQYRT